MKTQIQMAQQFITAPIFSNPYVSQTINNINVKIADSGCYGTRV